VLTYSGYYALGIDEVWDMIHRYIEFVKKNGYFDVRRNKQSKYWMYETINERLRNDFYQNPEIENLMPLLENEVLSARKSSFVAAKEALDKYYFESQEPKTKTD
jgi:LAO/AO transport system kinase